MIGAAALDTAFSIIDDVVKASIRVLPAVYEDQKNNVFDGGVTCAITSVSMLLQTCNLPEYGGVIPGIHRELEDVILKDIRANLDRYRKAGIQLGIGSAEKPATEQGLRTNFLFLKWYVKDKYGVDLQYSSCKKVTLNRLVDGIQLPFVMSTSNALTGSAGHIILARGRAHTATGLTLIANDPFGHYPYRTKKSGEEVYYDMRMFPSAGAEGDKIYHMLMMGNYPKK